MIGVTVVGAEKTVQRIGNFTRKGLPSALERGVAAGSILVRGELTKQLTGRGGSDPFWGRRGASGDMLAMRTGATVRRLSPGGRVFRRGKDFFSAVGSPDRHVRAHDEGATIVGNQYLRIPLAAAQTGAGQDRNVGRSVRGLPGLFIFRSQAGNLFIARRAARGALELLYLLVRTVTLRPRKMFQAVTTRTKPAVQRLIGIPVSVEVRKANGG